MEHAGNAKKAEEIIEGAWRSVHAVGEVIVESLGVETGDLVVLPAVIADDFAACIAICGEVGGPCSNVGGVEDVGDGGIVDGEGGCVPCRITVDDVSEPILVVEMLVEEETTLGRIVTSE